MHPYRKPDFTLQNAHEMGMLVKLRCGLCSLTHRYRSGDLLKICGNIPIWDIASRFRCEKCGRKDYFDARWQTVAGSDTGTIRIRKLVGIRMVKVYDWENGIC